MASAAEKKRAAGELLDEQRHVTVMHDNAPEHQGPYEGRKTPGHSAKLIALAEAAGWEVRVGWSLVLEPEGYRRSVHHNRNKAPRWVERFGVHLRGYQVRARALWTVIDGASSFEQAFIMSRGRFEEVGAEALMAYIKGE